MSLIHLTDANFKKEALESKVPVLVDFWATWCGPCKMIAPIVEELAKEYQGKINIGKVDVDSNPKTAAAYGIMSIPTLIFFNNGKVTEQAVGVLTKHELKKRIEANLNKDIIYGTK
jgi:thioredoxin 1